MSLYEWEGKAPALPKDETYWIAPNAQVIGDVRVSEGVGIWFGAVLRGDNEPITIGANTNVQENAVFHTDMGCPLEIGDGCTIGHLALLHGCKIGNNTLIGMNATVMNNAVVEDDCLVAAGALVTEGKHIPRGSLVVGSPAKVVRTLSDEEIELLRKSATHYRERMLSFRANLKPIGSLKPLTR